MNFRLFNASDLDRCIAQLRALHERLGKCVVEVRPYKRSRSLGLNSYHWAAVIDPIAGFIGDSPEETHRDLCGAYWGWVETPLGGRKPRRTTTTNEAGERDVLDWEKMTNFIHFCKVKAAEIGCPLPESLREVS